MATEQLIAIRDIADADLDQVIALWHAAAVARPWNSPERDIAFACRDAHSTILVAVQNNRVLGTAMIGEDGHRGWIYYMAVLPEFQKSGLGRRLLAAAESWLAARGCWKVQLLVRADNAVVRSFYEHLGYQDTHTACLQKIIER